jgi:hypothetical protein
MQRTTCCRIFTPALPEYPAASVRDYCSGAYTLRETMEYAHKGGMNFLTVFGEAARKDLATRAMAVR